ncbi:SDR family NAD(P)-dependent oxidoreductase [Streptomyces iranensis]|uniref:NAD(P)-dependent dehydrogenase (Short-subunit alcohol dehydrogenase family) n=1 Tax=Streptomyces iranensis TaxID=576784 RepID=A0A060ZU01_9ACTN|nr:SDR family NAD(P)-dependent oxidoreductase [Streptomyces iranensis]MBP2068677.1 NAD(P)-dependent dehydrogenase (short-subunit alcohol dehydrogenase family) [Streptomyces iranensis]CDR06866.1 short-chain dehydrogenase/reductase SDR [Streptomyces iranensis]
MAAETLDGLTAVVTGASSGVGAAAARRMAAMGASVVVVGRAVTRTRAVADEVGGTALPADFARFSEVRELAQHLISRVPRIDILVNNAGIVSPKRKTTSDGHELTVQVNFLSPFLLTSLLWEKLLQAPSALVINTSSSLYRFGKLNPDDLDQNRSRYGQMRSYNASKLASVVHAAEINRRAPDTMTAVAFHPGTVRSGLDRDSALVTAAKASLIGRRLTRSPEEGAEPIVRIATTDRGKLRDVFYNRLEPEPLRTPATDADLGARLWQRAHELTHAST